LPVLRHQLLDPGAIDAIEEDSIGPDELEGVPFDRVMTRRDRDPAAGPVMLDRELHGRRGHEADIDHVAADGVEPGGDGGGEHRAGRARISSQHDRRTGPRATGTRPLAQPEAEGPRPSGDDVRGQVLPYNASDARNADHQGVGHADNLIRGG